MDTKEINSHKPNNNQKKKNNANNNKKKPTNVNNKPNNNVNNQPKKNPNVKINTNQNNKKSNSNLNNNQPKNNAKPNNKKKNKQNNNQINNNKVNNNVNNINKSNINPVVEEKSIVKTENILDEKEEKKDNKEFIYISEFDNKRKNMIYIIVFGILLLSILFSASYAYFGVDSTNTNKLGNIASSVNCLGIVYSENNAISLDNSMPVTDTYALANYTPVTITVSNQCTSTVTYYLTLSSLSNATGYIPDYKVSIAMDKKTDNESFYRVLNPKFVSYLNKISASDTLNTTLLADLNRRSETSSYTNKVSYALDHDSIAQGQVKTYKLYMWVDYYEGDVTHTGLYNNSTQGLSYKASIGAIPVNQTSLARTIKSLSDGTSITQYTRAVTDECSASGCTTVNTARDVYYLSSNSVNNVVFGGICWKMLRTTELGGVKLLYNGVATLTDDTYTCGGDVKAINNNAAYKFNSTGVSTANLQTPSSVGYMYNETGTDKTLQVLLQADDVNKYDGEAKTTLEAWFTNWVSNNSVDTDKLEAAVYCNDRTLATSGASGGYAIANLNSTLDSLTAGKSYIFKSYGVTDENTAYLDCQNVTDAFSINNPKAGGSNMENVGMITLSEAFLSTPAIVNYTGSNATYWMMSPYLIRKDSATQYYTRLKRSNNNTTTFGDDRSHQTQRIRPVITLNSTARVAGGAGTTANPYIIN